MAEAFDESILAEIEQRLEKGDDQLDEAIAVGDKVELDRVDLPLDGFLPEATGMEPAEVEVDLADIPGPMGRGGELEHEPQPPSKAKKIIVAAAAMVGIVAMAAGVGFWYARDEGGRMQKPEEMPPWMVRQAMPKLEDELILGLEPFIVPLLESKDGQILRVTVTLESMDPLSKAELAERMIDLRDVIYRSLRDRPANELREAEKNRLLQAQIKAELNHSFGKDWVHKVYFAQFIISG